MTSVASGMQKATRLQDISQTTMGCPGYLNGHAVAIQETQNYMQKLQLVQKLQLGTQNLQLGNQGLRLRLSIDVVTGFSNTKPGYTAPEAHDFMQKMQLGTQKRQLRLSSNVTTGLSKTRRGYKSRHDPT